VETVHQKLVKRMTMKLKRRNRLYLTLTLLTVFVMVIYGWVRLTDVPPPEGRIIIQNGEDGDSEIYVMNADGSGRRKLTDNDVDDYGGNISSDGSIVVFTREQSRSSVEQFVINIDGSGETQVTFLGYAPSSDVSPNGQWIALNRGQNIYKQLLDGGDLIALTQEDNIDGGALWSPDGEQIAFYSSRDFIGSMQAEIYIMQADGSNPIRVTHLEGWSIPRSWSPDGRKLLITSNYGLGRFERRVYIIDLVSNKMWPLIDDENFSSGIQEFNAVWSPDGIWIAISVEGKLCIVNNKGEVYECFGGDYLDSLSDWGP